MSQCSSGTSAHFNACATVAFWENVCGMEGCCRRPWRQYRVAIEILAEKAENCPPYLHHPHCSPIARCQCAGQSEKSVWGRCQEVLLSTAWESEQRGKSAVYVWVPLSVCRVAMRSGGSWSEVQHCSFPLTTFMAHFQAKVSGHVHGCVFTSVCASV